MLAQFDVPVGFGDGDGLGDVHTGLVFEDFEDFEVIHGLDERGVLVRVFLAFGCDADVVVVRALGGD